MLCIPMGSLSVWNMKLTYDVVIKVMNDLYISTDLYIDRSRSEYHQLLSLH